MTKDCKNCESDIMDKYADLQLEMYKAEKQIKLLNECLDTKEELSEFYRQEIEQLKNKIRILEEG